MDLAVPLSQEQVDRAGRVHQGMPQWRLSDTALETLAEKVPGFSAEACLLKTVAINALYGTQLLATGRMAAHIERLLAGTMVRTAGFELVEEIASLPAPGGQKQRRFVSFASKFCHFFVNFTRFPMYDEAAREALKMHLGADACESKQTHRYLIFCERVQTLRERANLTCGIKDLDQYLWLTGMCLRWRKEKSMRNPRVNAELTAILQRPSAAIAGEIRAMLPACVAVEFG